MNICISKESEGSLRQQLAEQIVFLIATEKLRPGEALPIVRGLARRGQAAAPFHVRSAHGCASQDGDSA